MGVLSIGQFLAKWNIAILEKPPYLSVYIYETFFLLPNLKIIKGIRFKSEEIIKRTDFYLFVFNWNHFEMRLFNLRINFFIYCGLFVLILVGVFCIVSFFHYVSAKFHLWPSSGDLPRPRIGMLRLVTVSPVITAFHSCCLSRHVFLLDQKIHPWLPFGARGVADRGVESLRFHVSIVSRYRFQILPKPSRGLLCQKRGAIDSNYGRQ